MAITPNKKHDLCPVFVQLGPTKVKKKTGGWITHYASLCCAEHNHWIQWLNKSDVDKLNIMGVGIKPSRSKLLTEDDLGI